MFRFFVGKAGEGDMGRSRTWISSREEDVYGPVKTIGPKLKRPRRVSPSRINLRDEIPDKDGGNIQPGVAVGGRDERSCEEIEVGVEDRGKSEESCEEIEVEDDRTEEEEEYEVEESYEEIEEDDEECEEEDEEKEEDEDIEGKESYEIGRNEDSCEENEEAAAANNGGKGGSSDTAKLSGNGSISVTLTDPELLDCPVCFLPLTAPVFQCQQGHIACAYCCSDLKYKCPSCNFNIGYIRNTAIENILKSTKVACPNARYGCNETMSYPELYEHEEICNRARFVCPFSDCDFIGPYGHFHLHFLESCRDIYILYNATEHPGNLISVSCFSHFWNGGATYSIMVKTRRAPLKFDSCAKNLQNLDEEKTSLASLLVPSNLFDLKGQLSLSIHISAP
ncbi:E3 ubiquitin-protein ligase SINA-like 10 isoform X2 [Mangifera indica]|uniref:E3 ubiquitin-protein ligase SINA-like 10 isoform X2 n=1 Tax=Mangifera indica TaxID=29780 RepID=UPI001CF9AAEF|nr:E3 ubiquitin-protein ligase SINA-like 10 isoform X2 [Mangifera indica]